MRVGDFHVDDTDQRHVLEVAHLGKPSWKGLVDVAATYAERFATPVAFAIDGRIGATGELHLIAHVRDAETERLLPPHELTIRDGQLERSRLGIDRYAIDACGFVSVAGSPFTVRAETAVTFELVDGRSIAKSDRALGGPYLRLAIDRGWTFRIVQELDDHVLAVVDGTAAKALGWSVSGACGYRWFERRELPHLTAMPVTVPCSICAPNTGEHRPGLNTLNRPTMIGAGRGRIAICCACRAIYSIVDDDGTWVWTHVGIAKTAPATTVAPVVEPKPYRPAMTPDRARMTGRPPSDQRLAEHAYVEVAGRSVEIVGETATKVSLETTLDSIDRELLLAGFDHEVIRGRGPSRHRYTAALDKLDPRITGPFLYCVRFDDHVLRVIEDDVESVLLVCHPPLGPDVGFHRRDRVSFRWVRLPCVEVLKVERVARIERDGIERIDERAIASQHGRISIDGHVVTIAGETATSLALEDEGGSRNTTLIALGFECDEYETDIGSDGRKMNLDYEGLRHVCMHRLVVDKIDPRLSGAFKSWVRWQGRLLRVATEHDDHLLLVTCDSSIADFEDSHHGVRWRWVARADASELPVPTPVVVENRDRMLPADLLECHVRVELGRAAVEARVIEETADSISLREHSRDEIEALTSVGFACETHYGRDSSEHEYTYSLTLPKRDARLRGPFLDWFTYRGHLVRVAADRADGILLVAHASIGPSLGFEHVSVGDDESVWARWLVPADLETRRRQRPKADKPPGSVGLAGIDDPFEVWGEYPDVLVLRHSEPDRRPDLMGAGFDETFVHHYMHDEEGTYVYKQAIAKTDPRLTGILGLTMHAGYRLRFVERDGDRVRVVTSGLAELCALPADGWIPYREDSDPARPPIDPPLVESLRAHDEVMFAPLGRALAVVRESDHSITLLDGEVETTVDKTDGRIHAPFDRWVSYRGSARRAVADRGDHVLVVAHPSIGCDRLAQIAPTIACAWVPRAEAPTIGVAKVPLADPYEARRSADAHRLVAHAKVRIDGVERAVVAETSEMLELAGGAAIEKIDPRLGGPFEARVRYAGHVLRCVESHGARRLVIAASPLSEQLGFTHAATAGKALGFAWVSASDAPIQKIYASFRERPPDQLERFQTITLVHEGTPYPFDFKSEDAEGLVCEVESLLPRPECTALGFSDYCRAHNGVYVYGLRLDKRDPRALEGVLWVGRYKDMLVRVVAEHDDEVCIVVADNIAHRDSYQREGYSGCGWRWVPRREVVDPPPGDDVLYRSLRVMHAERDGALFVLDETADAFVLELGTVAKTDPRLIGPYGRLVLLRGNLLRVAEERGSKFLVIAHGRLGAELGFTIHRHDEHSLGWRWFRPSELDAV